MEFIKAWTKVDNLESTTAKGKSDADIHDLKEETFGKEQNKYSATHKNQKLMPSTPAPIDTMDAKPVTFLDTHQNNEPGPGNIS